MTVEIVNNNSPCPHNIHAWFVAKIDASWLYLECKDCGARVAKPLSGISVLPDKNWLQRLEGYSLPRRDKARHRVGDARIVKKSLT